MAFAWLGTWMLLGQIEMPQMPGASQQVAGSISGVVVNACQDNRPVGGADVVLRVMLDGQFVVAAETKSDASGQFLFEPIPVDADYVYLPGANHEGVHYPASRIRLKPGLPHAQIELTVHETVSEPNPLVLRRHDVAIRSERDAIHVTETLEIENPTLKTYVGRPKQEGGRATTLRLSIPSNFRRVTFDQEFYGRQFTLFEDHLVTDIPWTPGLRTLKLSYVLPADSSPRCWQRPVDLPCEALRIDVRTAKPDAVACDLLGQKVADNESVSFASTGKTFQAGQLITVQLEDAPLSLTSHGRWLALGFLGILIAATGRMWARPNRPPPRQSRSQSDTAKLRQAA